MTIQYFSTYKESADMAKHLSTIHKTTIQFGRKDSKFFVDVPDDIDHDEGIELERKYTDAKNSYLKDYDHQENQIEIREEISDYAESLARSDDEGWFYDETEGDRVDNAIDPKTDSV